jgi:hypothetical protein
VETPRGGIGSQATGFSAMGAKRKLIGFDPETLRALEQLARDRGQNVQELADEAFATSSPSTIGCVPSRRRSSKARAASRPMRTSLERNRFCWPVGLANRSVGRQR